MMGFYNFGGFGWIGMILSLLVTVAVIAGLVILIVWAVRRGGTNVQSGPQNLPGQTARELAQARYAKGEISREEYQQILSDLGQ